MPGVPRSQRSYAASTPVLPIFSPPRMSRSFDFSICFSSAGETSPT